MYGTSFIRERYLLQHALGLSALDVGVTAYGIAATFGNLWAVTLSIVWIDGGRRISPSLTRFWLYACAGIVLYPISPIGGSCVALASLVAAFEYNRQRAAFRGRQLTTLAAALAAPAAAIGLWAIFGVDSFAKILAGYILGYLFQSGVATLIGRHGPRPADTPGSARRPASLLWPVLFAALTQVNGVADRVILVFVGPGWAGAGGFAIGLASAAMLVVVGPLSSEAVAGRLGKQPPRRLVVGICLAGVASAMLMPSVLPLLISGSKVAGDNYDKVRNLSIVYMLSVPGSGYWLYRARALQTGDHMWQYVTMTGVVMLGVHLVVAVPAALTDHVMGVAGGTLLSSYVGAALLVREKSEPRVATPGVEPGPPS
ncbi:MAG: hypothetical protein M3256_20335 [Actinomycetota bacterium]|nr:hypothetical protein [Actinomycetota bacterium]